MKWVLPIISLFAFAGGALGQDPFRVDSARAVVLSRATRDRWVHEGQHPGFVPFQLNRDAIHLRALTTSLGRDRRSLEMRLRNLDASLRLDAANRITFATVEPPPLMYSRYDDDEDRVGAHRRLLSGTGAAMMLPYAHFWEAPFVVPGVPLSRGTTWSDTLSFVAGPGDGLSQHLDGVWRNRVVGDTLLDGRRLPVVRTEADVRYRTTEVEPDRSRDGDFVITRDLYGTLTGYAVVDTALGIRAGGADTASWSGTALLRTQEGKAYPSRVRYERTRSWALQDSVVWADSVGAERQRRGGGMLIVPTDSLQVRLAEGDSTLADSLLTRWRVTGDPDERYEIERLLAAWWARGRERSEALRTELTRLRRAAGDTTAGLFALDPSRRDGALTLEHTERVLPYLDDPGRMWRLGVVPTWTYTQLAGLLLHATPIFQPDSASWACAPEACQRLRSVLETASEPRLRDVALVGHFARDPARWMDRIRARADSGSGVVREALTLADGVGATWPAAPKDPMPPEGAGWRAWLSWLGGTVRFGDGHRDALRMYAARTGRDPLAEIRGNWPPPDDSARLVFGAILSGMGKAVASGPAALAEEVLSGTPGRIELAARALRPMLARAPAADPDIARELVAAVLDSILAGGDSPWPAVDGLGLRPGERILFGAATSFHGVQGVPRFVLEESLPPGLVHRLPPLLQPMDSSTWAQRPPRTGGALLRFWPMRAVGDFVQLSWSWTVFSPRKPDEAPSGYQGGGGLTLLRTSEGWQVVGRDAWIT